MHWRQDLLPVRSAMNRPKKHKYTQLYITPCREKINRLLT